MRELFWKLFGPRCFVFTIDTDGEVRGRRVWCADGKRYVYGILESSSHGQSRQLLLMNDDGTLTQISGSNARFVKNWTKTDPRNSVAELKLKTCGCDKRGGE